MLKGIYASFIKMALIICCFMIWQNGYCQFDDKSSAAPASPNVSATAKYANTTVNMYTGVPNISADLHTLAARGYSIPIALLYNGSGNKVQDMSSPIGLGWTMSANCLVSRYVRGLPDEGTSGYFGSSMGLKVTQPLDVTTMGGILGNTLDAEPDLFYYNLNGRYGKFVFNKDGVPVMLTDKSIRILNSPFKQELGLSGWVFEDIGGTFFYLGSDASSIENTQLTFYGETSNRVQNYASTWFLNKIITSNNTETITFSYVAGDPIKTTNYRKTEKFRDKITSTFDKGISFLGIPLSQPSSSLDFSVVDKSEWDSNIEELIQSPKYLSSIATSNQSAYFTYDTQARKDLANGKVLNKVDIKDYKGELIKSFSLLHDYFYSFYNDANDVTVRAMTADNYRLKLNNVTVTSGLTPVVTLPLFSFEYVQDINLPPRASNKFDHWGYYNNTGANSDNANLIPELQANMDREPSPVMMTANVLKKIYLPTGGYKEFVFEANTYYNQAISYNSYAGGLRIARIKSAGDPNTTPVITSYNYNDDLGHSTGKLINAAPIYVRYIEHTQSQFLPQYSIFSPNIPIYRDSGNGAPPVNVNNSIYAAIVVAVIDLFQSHKTTVESYSPFIIINSTSFNTMFDIDGSAIGYSQVTINNSNEGKTVNFFTDREDYPDYTNQLKVDGSFKTLERISPNMSPYTPATSYAFARGHLKQSLVYDNNNNLLKRITNKYVFNSVMDSVKGVRVAIGKVNISGTGQYQSINTEFYNIGNYYYIAKQLLLSQTTEENFITGNVLPVSTVKSYTYNSPYPSLLTNVTIQNSDNSTNTIDYKYVFNKDLITFAKQSETDAVNKLYADGKYGILLDQIIKTNNKVLKGSRVGYKNWIINSQTFTLPETGYENNGTTVTPAIQYFNYDQYGNLLCSNAKSGPKQSTIFGYNKLYPVAKAFNAADNDIFYESFEEGGGNISTSAKTGSLSFSGSYSRNLTGLDNGSYTLSYWLKTGNTWALQSSTVPVTSNSYTINITSGQIDDVRFYPVDAQMSTSTYTALSGLTGSTDIKNEATYFEYDQLLQLKNTKDQYGNIVKNLKYNYIVQQPGAVGTITYYSQAVSGGYSKNNCGTDATPNPIVVTYTIPANKYTSVISQADANQQAYNELIAEGQANANYVGGCRLTH